MKGLGFWKGREIRKTPTSLDLLHIDHLEERAAAGSYNFISGCSTKEHSSVLACGIFSLIAKTRQIYWLRKVQYSWLRKASRIQFW